MSLPEHLNHTYEDMRWVFPAVGEIMAVFPKDHPQNQTGGQFTTYQVKVHWQRPAHSALLNRQAPAKGQQGGGIIDCEIPYVKGQKVIVQFLEGDPNRPLIDGLYPDASVDNKVSQEEADYPRVFFTFNGVDFQITKEGNVKIKMASARSVQFEDQGGAIVVDIVENGEVKLGGSTGLNRLIDERAKGILEGHVHEFTLSPGPPPVLVLSGSPLSGALPMSLAGALTTNTKAK